jgi:hypothetical protein
MATYTATFTRTATGTTPATVSLASSLSSLPSGVSADSSTSISAVDPIASSQGTTFTFNGVAFVAKNVKVKRTQSYFDVTSLAAADGSTRILQSASVAEGHQITCEYWGTTAPARGQSAAIVCSTLGISGNAVCEDFELTAAVGELIVGNATFKLTG